MSQVKYCYICSGPRCGSTLLDILLGGHSRIKSMGEISFLGKVISLNQNCGCGVPISACDTWNTVFDRIHTDTGTDLRRAPYALEQWDARAVDVVDPSRQTPTYLARSKLRTAWMEARARLPRVLYDVTPLPRTLAQGRDNAFYLFDLLRELWESDIVVDSSKSFFKAVSLYEAAPESSRIILLTRDGRGTYFSCRQSGYTRKKSVESWRKYYARANALIDRFVAPEHRMSVRYEDIATDTEQTLRRMCDFLQQPFERGMLELDAGQRHVINGNQGTKTSRSKGVRLDERWRHQLEPAELSYFDQHAGTLNRTLGYME